MSDMMNEFYSTQDHQVISTSIILGHKVVYREIWLTLLEPSHICAYVRLTPPFRSSDDDDYSDETFREEDVFGVDTAHFSNRNQNMTQKQEDAKWQITQLIQEHINWQSEQSITHKREFIKPKPVHERVKRFLNLEL